MFNLGENVRSERVKRGLTQQQVADKAGVGINFVYQLEKNKPRVQMDSVMKVLRVLGLEISLIRSNEPDTGIDLSGRPDPWRQAARSL